MDAGESTRAASLLFAAGARPDARAIAVLASKHSGFAVSLDPPADIVEQGGVARAGDWLELVADGLTFDLSGLAPGGPAGPPPRSHVLDLSPGIEDELLEAIALRPGPHLVGGGAMTPVVRSLAWLASQLADLPGARAIAWHPARSWCGVAHFRDSVLRWIEGGVFPGFGFATLAAMPDGGMRSHGLALFVGQELRLEPELAASGTTADKLGRHVMQWLLDHGRLLAPERIAGPDDLPLRLEPSANGRFVRVWKG